MVTVAALDLTARSLPLVFMFVASYWADRFGFFDLFVKRGLGLACTIAVLTAAFAMVLPRLKPIAGSPVAPWVYAIVLLPAVAAVPWLHARVGAALDRWWLGRRYTTVEAVKRFVAGLRSATTEAQLVAQAEAELEEIFGAPAAVTIGDGETPSPDFAIVEQAPVRSGDAIIGRLLMGSRASEAPYFSEDRALLATLADVFASVVLNLDLQRREQEKDRHARELSLHASRSELKALRAQINPHFLFNALNAIAALIHRNPAVADETVEKLADVFRYALRGAESEWAVLDNELEFVRSYLDVERARFGDRLQTDVHADEDLRGARIPTMIVQTLVENAVKHGVAQVRGRAIVQVTARSDRNRLIVSVTDNGPGFRDTSNAPQRTEGGYGLANVRQRLEGYFGANASLSVVRDTAAGLTVVSVSLPRLNREPHADVHPEIAAAQERTGR
jgi:signal transduction histidine kinase